MENTSHEDFITLEIDNLWFMDFVNIPLNDMSPLRMKYNKEILRVFCQKDQNTHKILSKHLLKILKKDYSIATSYPILHCLKITDSFQNKKIRFDIIIEELNVKQIEFKLNIKPSLHEKFVDSHQELIDYLKQDVLDIMFCDLLI